MPFEETGTDSPCRMGLFNRGTKSARRLSQHIGVWQVCDDRYG
jgi:hypothetical protein